MSTIEAALRNPCPLIGQVCVIGDGRPHLAALLVLEPPDAATEPSTCSTVAAAIKAVNATLPPLERIEAKYVAEIEALYA